MDNKKSHHTLIKNIPIIQLSINLSINIKTGYNFYKHHYLKSKVVLSLLLLTNIVYFNTNCLITLYDIIFFQTQALDILILEIVTYIMV